MKALNTIVDLLYAAKSKYADKAFLQYSKDSELVSISFRKFVEMAESLSYGLYDIGLRKGDKVGIVSDNMYKWLISDIAILSLGAVDVPRGSDSSIGEIFYILNHSNSKLCFVEDPDQAEKVFANIDKLVDLKGIVLLNGELSELEKKYSDKVKMYHFDALLAKGKDLSEKYSEAVKMLKESVEPDDVATLIYTSGTTGIPKGVMLTHKNVVSDVLFMKEIIPINESDRAISILPVWHVYERTVEYVIMYSGASITYCKPTAKHLLPMMAKIKPTYMVSVPRIWEALYNGIMIQVKGYPIVRKTIFYLGMKIGYAFLYNRRILTGKEPLNKKMPFLKSIFRKKISFLKLVLLFIPELLADLLVFSKIRQKTGGKFEVPISGGGKLPNYLDDFFSAVKINIHEGYGMTETSPVIAVRDPGDIVPGTVGKPLPGVEISIRELDGSVKDNFCEKGVVWIKSDIVMKGYYKDPDGTAKVIKEGWLNTGDLGRLTITGEIQIVGRVKETIVLTDGENIEPVPIEESIKESLYIEHVMLVGQDQKYLSALIVPSQDNLKAYADDNNIEYSDFIDLCGKKEIINLIDNFIKTRVSVKSGFKPSEKIKYFTLLPVVFEVGEELTNSLKMKRDVITEKYQQSIQNMYK